MSTTIKVTIHYTYQSFFLLVKVVTKSGRSHGLGIGDTIQSILIRQLSYRVQRSQQTALLSTVGR